jgi:ABC-2 type transport system permease protein
VDFEKRVLRGEAVTIPIFGDATNRMANGQIQQDISATYNELSLRYNQAQLMRAGFSTDQASVLLSRPSASSPTCSIPAPASPPSSCRGWSR